MKIWKKRISAILAAALLVTAISPNIRVQAGTSANAESGSNAIEAETEYYSETPSNATKIVVETPSNAAELGIVDFTEPGPVLPATGGIMMFRMMRAVAETSNRPEGIFTSKTATANDDGTYTIKLESYVEGNVTSATTTKPLDIVLVLDVSGSMADCIKCGRDIWSTNQTCYTYDYQVAEDLNTWNTYYIKSDSEYESVSYCSGWHNRGGQQHNPGWFAGDTGHSNDTAIDPDSVTFYTRVLIENGTCEARIDALETAVNSFIDEVASSAEANEVDHRIAIVTFASNSTIVNGLTDVSNSNNVGALKNRVSSLVASGATRSDLGMQNAVNLIDGIEPSRQSTKVVILFTDGVPTSQSAFNETVANSAISSSKTLKDAGVSVYTIGIFAGANPNANISEPYSSTDSEALKANRYMQYVSSNYKNATSLADGGKSTKPSDGSSYYLSASNSEKLNEVFKNLSETVTSGDSKVNLGTETVVEDVISDYFDLFIPEEGEAVEVWTEQCTGKDSDGYTFTGKKENTVSDGPEVTVSDDRTTISVDNFDYKGNYVSDKARNESTGTFGEGETFYGRKLVIEFKVAPKADFLGGNNVPTNNSASLKSDNLPEDAKVLFDVPHVNVPIGPVNVDVTAANKNIYLTGSLTEAQLKEGATATSTYNVGSLSRSVTLDLSKANYGLEKWQTYFVDITVQVPSGKVNLLEDDSYTVTVTIAPKEAAVGDIGTEAETKTGSDNANIYVFTPTITFKDGEAYYGDELPDETYFNSLRVDNPEWKHVANGTTTISTAVTMIGDEPVISTSDFTPDAAKVIKENSKTFINTKEDVPVKVDSIMIGETPIEEYTTLARNKCDNNEVDLTGFTFVLHIKTCSLDVQKVGGSSEETYIMNVKRNGDDYTTVTVTGGETVSLKELPVGTYTIKEDTNWSWRYEATVDDTQGILTKSNPEGILTCENRKKNDYWLSFASTVKNIFVHGEDGEKSE